MKTSIEGPAIRLWVLQVDRCTGPERTYGARDTEECNVSAAMNVPVTLVWASAARIEARTDGRGQVLLSFHDVSLDDIRALDTSQVSLSFGGVAVPFEVRAGTIEKEARAEPTSRVNLDATTAAEQACAQHLAAANDRARDTNTNPDGVESAWSDARKACGTAWNSEREKALSDVSIRVQAARCALASEAAKRQVDNLGQVRTVTALNAVEADVERAGQLCSDDAAKSALDELRRRAATELVNGAQSALKDSDYDSAFSMLNTAERFDPSNKAIAPTRARAAKIMEREEARIAAKEGPMWHIEGICSGVTVTETWKRGRSQSDVKRKLCENLAEPMRADCMYGPRSPGCTVTFTKVKCDRCR